MSKTIRYFSKSASCEHHVSMKFDEAEHAMQKSLHSKMDRTWREINWQHVKNAFVL